MEAPRRQSWRTAGGAQVWPQGATRRRAGEGGVTRVAEPGVGVEGTGAPGRHQESDKQVSALPPPAPAETSLSSGAAQRVRPAQSPGTGLEKRTTPPRP